MDCPFHRYAHGKDLSEITIDQFTDLDAVILHLPCTERLSITQRDFMGYELKNKAVLVHTGWDIHWNTETEDSFFKCQQVQVRQEQQWKLLLIHLTGTKKTV